MRFIMLALALGCASQDIEEQPVEPVDTTEGSEEIVRRPVEEGSGIDPILTANVAELVEAQPMFEGWTLVPLAQLERDDRIVVVVWPAIDPNGQVVDDDIIGLTLQRGETLNVVEGNWSVRPSAIGEHLGGEPVRGDRGEGVPADLLANLLASLPALFAEHVASGDREGAVEAAISFSRLFAFEHAVESDTVSEILALHTRGARIETQTVEPGRVRARFFEGDDMVEEEMLIAEERTPNRWVFTDHERIDAGVR